MYEDAGFGSTPSSLSCCSRSMTCCRRMWLSRSIASVWPRTVARKVMRSVVLHSVLFCLQGKHPPLVSSHRILRSLMAGQRRLGSQFVRVRCRWCLPCTGHKLVLFSMSPQTDSSQTGLKLEEESGGNQSHLSLVFFRCKFRQRESTVSLVAFSVASPAREGFTWSGFARCRAPKPCKKCTSKSE